MKVKNIIILISLLTLAVSWEWPWSSSNNNDENQSTLLQLREGEYNISSEESELNWVGKNITSKIHTGTLQIQGGTISINADGIVSGSVVVDMSTINTTNLQGEWKDKLDGHLKSSDFFSVDEYPTASFTFTSKANLVKDNVIEFNGELTIKNITHPLNFTAEILETNLLLKAKSSITFDRSKYDIRYGSGSFFEDLGDNLILDDINFDVLLVAQG